MNPWYLDSTVFYGADPSWFVRTPARKTRGAFGGPRRRKDLLKAARRQSNWIRNGDYTKPCPR